MAFKSYILNFQGFWLLEKMNSIPDTSGIYCVYSCVHFPASNTVHVKKLIHIGGAIDVRARITAHKKLREWKLFATPEKLCFSFAPVKSSPTVITRITEAMIYKHSPPFYDKRSFPHPNDRTQIQTKGVNAELHHYFTVPY